MKDGEYTASAEGYEGPITVKVVIKEGKIFSVEVLSHNETPEYYEMAKKILQTIVEKILLMLIQFPALRLLLMQLK